MSLGGLTLKTKHLLETLKDYKANAIWITDPTNVFYFTGFHTDPHERLLAFLITESGEEILVCPQLDVEAVKNSPFEGKIIGYLDTESPYSKLPYTFNHLLIEEEHLTVKRYNALHEAFSVNQFSSIDLTIKNLRNIKSESELEILRKATDFADQCIKIGQDFLKEGITEREVVNHIEQTIKQRGVDEMSFDTMVLFGDHAAEPHGVPGDRKLKQDEYVLFDLGVVYEHYCSDITRTVAFGTPESKAQEIYNTVLEAEQAAIELIKPGITIKELDDKARGIIEQAGYGEYFPHRLGHGLGLGLHEFPDISNTNTNTLEEGMVFTIEPGIYVPGVAGVRIEDDIYVTENGCEILTHAPK
ncbi:M24 family metallopeptidase [Staphylococcus canis]|uniref:Aminopeptidase P family protein n=1 Tax=Staphylococcus canis TaxID=2724942 RepID=A0ABS0T8Z7_9STAP|nr:Xaa-Pro peptidase family protein [Staphylococcus canis]MBI5974233.1 aminopeptidase P family protein [Staphylococcus canis]